MSSSQLEQRCEELQRAVEEARGQERVMTLSMMLILMMTIIVMLTIVMTMIIMLIKKSFKEPSWRLEAKRG